MALHVERLGAGPDLVLLHGWGLHGGVWRAIAPRLGKSFRLHVIDLPGHGHSREHAFEDLDSVVDAVAQCIPEDARVCGWSLGGLVALRLATQHPSRVAALALVSTTPCFVQRPGWPHAMADATLAQFVQELREDPAKTVRRFVNLNALGGPKSRDRTRELAALFAERGGPPAESLAAGLALLRETDLREEVARIEQPAVAIHGGRDRLAPVGAGRWLASRLASARFVEIPDAAHLPFVSHCDEVAQALGCLHG